MSHDSSRFYVTTAIPYVNGAPHAGHALEACQADVLARFHRQAGNDTYFLTGSDDNSLTNVQAAERENIPVADLVARNTDRFVELDRQLDISYDQFIRTSVDPRHRLGSEKLWRAVDATGDIYRKEYSGLYCPNCEMFYEEDELVNGLCPDHDRRPDLVHETNHFFRLSKYQEQLERLISTDTYRITPVHRKNEVLSFIRSGLKDFSISRSVDRARGWGIPVPGDEKQVMYVWFDALSNYITALGYDSEDDLYRRYWVENPCRMHVIGKGIVRFHAVYWPAMLLSAGVPLPHALFVHGYYTVGGRSMSKTLGNVIDPTAVINTYGCEATRYYLLAGTHPTGDTDFSLEAFETRYNADLANDLGNLVNRTISMVKLYRDGIVPTVNLDASSDILALTAALSARIETAMSEYDFQGALTAIWGLVSRANKFVEEQAPWSLAKRAASDQPEAGELALQLDRCLRTLVVVLAVVSHHLAPFLPTSAQAIADQLGLSHSTDDLEALEREAVAVSDPTPLFPRLERQTAAPV